MRTQAQLCHIDANRCVVLVTAYDDTDGLGSALGEAATAEQAEDRALERLRQRLLPPPDAPAPKTAAPSSAAASPQTAATPKTTVAPKTAVAAKTVDAPKVALDIQRSAAPPLPPSEAPTDPDDWSDELAAVDLEIERIGWDRDQERNYLERAFGHGSRHKLTRYNDLVAYLKRLKALEPGTSVEAAPVPLRRADLITQGDQMLQLLEWSGDQARAFLQRELGATSRQSLQDEQLLAFNMLLENELVSKQR
ncbi:MAG: hypothetical protein ACON4T_09315 [Synechococcus sp.]